MPYIVEYDKLIGDNTWLEGINMGFKHEIEAAKYGRELSRSDLNSNIKIYKVWLLKHLNILEAYTCCHTYPIATIVHFAINAYLSGGYGGEYPL